MLFLQAEAAPLSSYSIELSEFQVVSHHKLHIANPAALIGLHLRISTINEIKHSTNVDVFSSYK